MGAQPPGSPHGDPIRERCSNSKDFLTCFSVPRKETPVWVPLTEPLHRERCSISRAIFTYLSKFPEKVPPSRFPSQSLIEMLCSQSLRVPVSRSPWWKNPPPGHPLGPLWKEMLIIRVFYTYLSQFHVKEPPSKFPIGSLRREMPITRAFYMYHSECLIKEPPFQFPLSEPR
jgi:hypothetical protein